MRKVELRMNEEYKYKISKFLNIKINKRKALIIRKT